MSDQITPALTADEWTIGMTDRHSDLWGDSMFVEGTVGVSHRKGVAEVMERHAMAALCLHQQPFGFTQEMLDELGSAAAALASITNGDYPMLDQIYDRIQALLPPNISNL